jgi:DNA-binding PadR family transcriptional regulator
LPGVMRSDNVIGKKLEPIRVIEKQSGLSRLLIYIYLQDSIVSEGIISAFDRANIHPATGFPALKKAIALGLVTSDYDDSYSNRRRNVQLTEKGKRIAKLLKEINDILSE